MPFPSAPRAVTPPTDLVFTTPAGGTVDHVERAEVRATLPDGVELAGVTSDGNAAEVTVSLVAPGVARVRLRRPGLAEGPRARLARTPPGPAAATVARGDGTVTVAGGALAVRARLDPFLLTFTDGAGRVLLTQREERSDVSGRTRVLPLGCTELADGRVAHYDTFTAAPDEHFYGFGEKFTAFDKRGQRLCIWMRDALGASSELAYKNVPFFVSSRGYAVFVDSTTAVRFDMAATNHAAWSLVVPDTVLDYYVLAGPPARALRGYAELVGFPLLPPRWAFGLWMSSGFYADDEAAVRSRAKELRDRGVHADVLHLDCYWQRFGRWSDMAWDAEAFPDPEGLLADLDADGYKVCLWMNPYIGVESPRLAEAAARGLLLRTPGGEPYIVDQWSGSHPPGGIVDLTNPEAVAWFSDLIRPVVRAGAAALKTDFGEAVPADAVAANGMTGEQLHNLYPLLYNDVVAEVLRAERGDDHMLWGRSTYAGGQRHLGQWSGDPSCTWEDMAATLRGGLSMAMCGHPFWSHDVGGFHGTPSPELYVRWAQFGLLSPLVRAHGTSSRLPWDFGEEALGVFLAFAGLRRRLLPYLYGEAVEAVAAGQPLLRPVALDHPDDPAAPLADLQYGLGRSLLVAPVCAPGGTRTLYLPAGPWFDWWTGEVAHGPGFVTVTMPLERVPLYVRGNHLLPIAEPGRDAGRDGVWSAPPRLDAWLLPDAGGRAAAACRLHLPEGPAPGGVATVAVRYDAGRVEIATGGLPAGSALRLWPGGRRLRLDEVTVDGRALPLSAIAGDDGRLRLGGR